MIRDRARTLSLSECRTLYRALAGNDGRGDQHKARACLIGQPVALGRDPQPAAALRISASARLVSEAWSSDPALAERNLQRAIGDAASAISGLESLLANDTKSLDVMHGS